MGEIIHKAIIVTSWDESSIHKAHEVAEEIFGEGYASPILPVQTNGYQTFIIPPDGSKLGWTTHEERNWDRGSFRDWLEHHSWCEANENSRIFLEWVEVQWGRSCQPLIRDYG